jgi:3-hydroxyisobutyrate dehydrogenase-like beta-hydroxyacid dehydrogenase
MPKFSAKLSILFAELPFIDRLGAAARAGHPAALRQDRLKRLSQLRIQTRQHKNVKRMIKRTFKPGFRIELHPKDLNLALEKLPSFEIGQRLTPL